ncbi:MAG: hypothetical protein Q7J85_10010 [Bacillota bacterium]|nr:hypothetical protein [Bacillota bacterium]
MIKNGRKDISLLSRSGLLKYPRQKLYCTDCDTHFVPLDTILPQHNGRIVFPGFEEICCLVASDIPYETSQRLLGFFCDDENIITDHSIENIAMRCGEDLRNYLEQTQKDFDAESSFVPRNSRKQQKAWPEEIKESVGDLIHQNNSGQIPEGLSRYDWKRAKQYYNENFEPFTAIDDEILSQLSQLGPKPQPGELLIFVDEILVNNWDQAKYLQHLTGALVTTAGIYYLSGENLVEEIRFLVKKINPQSITVIADGAKWITKQIYLGVLADFTNKTLILDWYHLEKKSKELLSMICYGKSHKNEVFSSLMRDLWHGKIDDALVRLAALNDKCRNQGKLSELIGYINTRKESIPNYDLRRQKCLYNGSGIVEKANDLLVARRQKNTSMQWTRRGGDALLAFKTILLNKQWDSYWVHRGNAA